MLIPNPEPEEPRREMPFVLEMLWALLPALLIAAALLFDNAVYGAMALMVVAMQRLSDRSELHLQMAKVYMALAAMAKVVEEQERELQRRREDG